MKNNIKNLTQRITELRQDLESEILNKRKTENKCQELERIIRKLRKDEQVLIGLQNNFTQLQTDLGNQITTLTTEKDRIQGELNNLQTRFCRLQGKFLGSLFRSRKKSKEIRDLELRIAKLRVQSIEKDQQIENLTARRDNLQTQLRDRDQTITNLTDQLNSWQTNYNNVNNQLSVWTNQFPNENANQVQTRINNLQNELQKEQDWWEKWINDKRIFISYDTRGSGELSSISIFSPIEGKLGILAEDIGESRIWGKTKALVKDYIYQYYRDK